MKNIALGDILNDGVSDVSDNVEHRRVGVNNGTEIMCNTQNGPPVLDGTEGGVLGTGEFAVGDELATNVCVGASLEGSSIGLEKNASQGESIGR